MQPTRTLSILLVLSSLIAMGIGAMILIAPAQFHAGYGIELGTDSNLLSEVRAPGGALLVLGALMLVGVFVRSFTHASASIAAAVYLAYGMSRLVSIGLDGMPGEGLVAAMAIELVIGVATVVTMVRSREPAGVDVQPASRHEPLATTGTMA